VGLAMSNENKEQESIENDVNVTVDKSKRKFSKAGIVAPVIMTLANRPAWGAQNMCSISGFDSLNVQQNPISGVDFIEQSCGNHISHGHWRGEGPLYSWPGLYRAAERVTEDVGSEVYAIYSNDPNDNGKAARITAKVSALPDDGFIYNTDDVFGTSTGLTLLEVLNETGNTYEFLRNMIGLLLAQEEGGFAYLSKIEIIGIYNALNTGGTYTFASSGITWSYDDFNAYHIYLMAHHT